MSDAKVEKFTMREMLEAEAREQGSRLAVAMLRAMDGRRAEVVADVRIRTVEDCGVFVLTCDVPGECVR